MRAEYKHEYVELLLAENNKLLRELQRLRRPIPSGVRWYGLKGGYTAGVYTDYMELQKHQKVHGGSCQRFPTREEAEAFVEEGRRNPSLRDQREMPVVI